MDQKFEKHEIDATQFIVGYRVISDVNIVCQCPDCNEMMVQTQFNAKAVVARTSVDPSGITENDRYYEYTCPKCGRKFYSDTTFPLRSISYDLSNPIRYTAHDIQKMNIFRENNQNNTIKKGN